MATATAEKRQAVAIDPDMPEAEQKWLARDIERSQANLRRKINDRKNAPSGVRMGAVAPDPREELVRRYVPEAIPKPVKAADLARKGQRKLWHHGATHDVIWDRPGEAQERHDKHIGDSYEPVIVDGRHLRQGAALAYKRPIEFKRAELEQADAIGRERLKATAADLKAGDTSEGVTEDTTEINEGKLQPGG